MMLQGAYVSGWLWVGFDEPVDDRAITDEEIRCLAKDKWEDQGECEIDEQAIVSRSGDCPTVAKGGACSLETRPLIEMLRAIRNTFSNAIHVDFTDDTMSEEGCKLMVHDIDAVLAAAKGGGT